uniref:Uncharacterized protein n=1 Tax=Arundo donax TaxID=35708 RepID=A0A0A9FP75_ARUDO
MLRSSFPNPLVLTTESSIVSAPAISKSSMFQQIV